MTDTELNEGLAQFIGTEAYHKLSPLHGDLVVTDGVLFLAQEAKAFWLIDAIASHQREALKDSSLRQYQFWTLEVAEDKSAVLKCERDTDDVAIRQEIPFTDFPMRNVRVWVQPMGDGRHWVAMLPSEW